VVLFALCGAGGAHAAGGSSVELAQAIELVKREVAAAVASTGDSRALQIDEAQLDFALVEVGGGSRLAVPTADFGATKDAGRESRREGGARPSLRRHVALDLLISRPPVPVPAPEVDRGAGPAAGAGAPVQPGPAATEAGVSQAAGPLAREIAAIVGAAREGAAVEPAFEAKRLGIDLELAFERDTRGAPVLIVHAADRRIEPRNVQKLRLKLSARGRSRSDEPAPERTGERTGVRTGERAADAAAGRLADGAADSTPERRTARVPAAP